MKAAHDDAAFEAAVVESQDGRPVPMLAGHQCIRLPAHPKGRDQGTIAPTQVNETLGASRLAGSSIASCSAGVNPNGPAISVDGNTSTLLL